GRGARVVFAFVRCAIPIAALASQRSRLYRELGRAFSDRVSFDRGDVALPEGLGRSATSRYPDAPVVALGHARLEIAGRALGSVDLLDSAEGSARVAAGLATPLPAPR